MASDIKHKRALIIVDVQPAFLNKRNDYIVANILKLLDTAKYDSYIEATFHAEKDSLWQEQQEWTCPEGDATKTVPELSQKLSGFDPIKVRKETKSAFKGDKDLVAILKENNIK